MELVFGKELSNEITVVFYLNDKIHQMLRLNHLNYEGCSKSS